MKEDFIAKDKTKYVIRFPKTTDNKSTLKFFNRIVEEKPVGLSRRSKNKLSDADSWLRENLKKQRQRKGIFLVADFQGSVIGSCEVQYHHPGEDGNHIFLLSTAVDRDHRGKGIGSRLINKVISETKRKYPNIEIIELCVKQINTAAQRLYKRIGFKKVGSVPKRSKRGNKYITDVYMHYYIKKK
ncbi:MAG TPA: GNAT family N-acetyltransferase [Candidatus Woesearchaeota archaeon]|nr:GNAT family N-acetyltransferase [Candidatus Woesearchaeota archaeon]